MYYQQILYLNPIELVLGKFDYGHLHTKDMLDV